MSTEMYSQKKTNTQWLFLGGAGVLILVFLMLYFNGVTANDEVKVQDSFNALLQAKTYHVKSDLSFSLPSEINGRERPINTVHVVTQGDVQVRNNIPLYNGIFDLNASGRGMNLVAKGDIVALTDSVAFKLGELPALLDSSGKLLDKWTYANVPILKTQNKARVITALKNFFQGWNYVNEEKVPGTNEIEAAHFTRAVTPEQETILATVLSKQESGNKALNVVSRLLKTFDIKSVDAWVDKKNNELSLVRVAFVHPEDKNRTAFLSLSFSDYGKSVSVTEPEHEYKVDPAVFGRIFNEGVVSSFESQQ